MRKMERIYAILKKNFSYDEARQKRKGLYFAGGSIIKELNEDDLLEKLVVYGMNEGFDSVEPYLSNLLNMRRGIYGNSKLFGADATRLSNQYKAMRAECVKKGFYKPKFPVRDRILGHVKGSLEQAERLSSLSSDCVPKEMEKTLAVSINTLKNLATEIEKVLDGSSQTAFSYAERIFESLQQWRNYAILDGLEGSAIGVAQAVERLKESLDCAREWATLLDGVSNGNKKANVDKMEKYDAREDQLTSFV